MRNVKLIIEYDGTNYAGWQRQLNAKTIQGTLEKAIEVITGEKCESIGASRTDAGVHAKGFICNFKTESRIPITKFKDALNVNLPMDIVVLNSEEVPIEFHSRYNCIGKTYTYTVLNRQEAIAIGRNYVYNYRRKLDINKMLMGSQYLIGKHDFAAFKNMGGSVKTSIRTITQLDIKEHNNYVTFTISADGFLYNMVRIIVGTLMDVGIQKISPEDVEAILQSKNRRKAGKAAPANGLCLEKVYY